MCSTPIPANPSSRIGITETPPNPLWCRKRVESWLDLFCITLASGSYMLQVRIFEHEQVEVCQADVENWTIVSATIATDARFSCSLTCSKRVILCYFRADGKSHDEEKAKSQERKQQGPSELSPYARAEQKEEGSSKPHGSHKVCTFQRHCDRIADLE